MKLFTIKDIDEGFKSLNIRFFDGDKPSSLASVSLNTVDSNLHQHAMQMWTFARFLPIVIGNNIYPRR
jgi:hypothetical protein